MWAAQKLYVVRPDGPSSVLQRCLHCTASCENVDSDCDKQDDSREALIAGNNTFWLHLIGPLISSDLVQIYFFLKFVLNFLISISVELDESLSTVFIFCHAEALM